MTETIDHAAEARQIVETFYAPSPEGAQMITEAQVHATLALVEQQRLANLISIAMWNSRALVEGARHVGDAPVDHAAEVARVDAMFAEVKKGMGI